MNPVKFWVLSYQSCTIIDWNSIMTGIFNDMKTNNRLKGKLFEQMHHQRRYMNGKQMKRCSALLIIREMQVKITMKYHHTPVWLHL